MLNEWWQIADVAHCCIILTRGYFSPPPAIPRHLQAFVPPNLAKYAFWGNPDMSLRFAASDTGKTTSVHEMMHAGQITCLAFIDATLMVTGGSDTVRFVFECWMV